MNHFIETVKEQPWHRTLGMVLFAITMAMVVVAMVFAQPMVIGGIIGIVLLFWAGNSFIDFMHQWACRRRVFKDYEVPEYKRSMHRVIEPKKHTANFHGKD